MNPFHLSRLALVAAVVILPALLPAVAEDGPRYVPRGSPRNAKERQATDEVGRPFHVYDEAEGDYKASGWMPHGDIALSHSLTCADGPQRGKVCYKATCDLTKDDWMGVAWLLDGKWEPERKLDLFAKLDARPGDPIVLRFWARSADADGTTVQFKAGGAPTDSLRPAVSTGWVTLGRDWKRYQIDLTGKHRDLSATTCAFLWVVNQPSSGVKKISFQVDNVYFVRLRERPRE